MEPLRVTAIIPGPIALPGGPVALDAMLMAAAALRDNLPPVLDVYRRIEIPVALAPGGRFHLASFSVGRVEGYDRKWINRRFPVETAQQIGAADVRRLRLTSGPSKSYRLPLEVCYLADARLDWYCVGDAVEIRRLLAFVPGVGKKRSVGNGTVERWEVERIEPWDGFPVVRDGKPLRPLPLDWPGLVDPEPGHRTLGCVEGPYWDNTRRELCAVPSMFEDGV